MSVQATVALQRQRGQSRVMVAYMRRVGDHLADIKSLLEVEERDRAKQRRLYRFGLVQDIDALTESGNPHDDSDRAQRERLIGELELFDTLWPDAASQS